MVAQILGTILKVNYTIDPAVHGTATLHTVRPLNRSELVPTAGIAAGAEWRGAGRRTAPSIAWCRSRRPPRPPPAGPEPPARWWCRCSYASAEDLAKVLQPYVGEGGKIAADPGRNALLIAGEPQARDGLIGLVKAFDVDVLARQSYALLPVIDG